MESDDSSIMLRTFTEGICDFPWRTRNNLINPAVFVCTFVAVGEYCVTTAVSSVVTPGRRVDTDVLTEGFFFCL